MGDRYAHRAGLLAVISVCVGLCWFIVNRVRKQPSCSGEGYFLAQDALRSEFGGLVRLGCPRGHYAVCGELHTGRHTPRTPAGRVVPAVVRTPGQVAEHVDLGPATPEFPPGFRRCGTTRRVSAEMATTIVIITHHMRYPSDSPIRSRPQRPPRDSTPALLPSPPFALRYRL